MKSLDLCSRSFNLLMTLGSEKSHLMLYKATTETPSPEVQHASFSHHPAGHHSCAVNRDFLVVIFQSGIEKSF